MSSYYQSRVIKMIGTKDFIVELVESENGTYHVITEVQRNRVHGAPLRDLAIALSIFDVIVQELENEN